MVDEPPATAVATEDEREARRPHVAGDAVADVGEGVGAADDGDVAVAARVLRVDRHPRPRPLAGVLEIGPDRLRRRRDRPGSGAPEHRVWRVERDNALRIAAVEGLDP